MQPAQVLVRQSREQDVPALELRLPTGGNRYHEGRFRRQVEGRSTFLIAFIGDVPVGCGEVLWQGPKEADVRDRFPDCPEINGLAVASEHRSRGIGTSIIDAAERLAARRGRYRIGMGVDDSNGRAAALYLRLGYRESGCSYLDQYAYVGDDGTRHEVADRCRFLIKELGRPANTDR